MAVVIVHVHVESVFVSLATDYSEFQTWDVVLFAAVASGVVCTFVLDSRLSIKENKKTPQSLCGTIFFFPRFPFFPLPAGERMTIFSLTILSLDTGLHKAPR